MCWRMERELRASLFGTHSRRLTFDLNRGLLAATVPVGSGQPLAVTCGELDVGGTHMYYTVGQCFGFTVPPGHRISIEAPIIDSECGLAVQLHITAENKVPIRTHMH
jgi:hypothetical protein